MNYAQALAKANTLLQQKHHTQAVQAAASALEHLLVELYNELLGQSTPAQQKQLVEAYERIGGGQPLHKLTLGKLVAAYKASHAEPKLGKTLGLELELAFFNVQALDPLVDIRNRAVHEGHDPDAAEAAYVVNQLELILRETGRLPPIAQSQRPDPQSLTPWWHTVMPHRDIREGRFNLKIFAIDLAEAVGEGAAAGQPSLGHRRSWAVLSFRSFMHLPSRLCFAPS